MQTQTLQIYDATQALSSNGPWIDISNLVSLSVQVVASQSTTDIEVSNDPNVNIDGPAIGPPSAAPTLAQYAAGATFQSGVSELPAATYFVKTTFITKWGETTGSPESTLAVSAGNYLFVAAPVPSAAQAPYVTGYNVYVSTVTGTETLQTAPVYQPQRLLDGIGSIGGTVEPLGPGQSTHFALTGALSLKQNFSMVNGLHITQWLVPGSDQSGGANSGASVSDTLGLQALLAATGTDVTSVSIFGTNANLMWSPSSMTWKWLRVTHGAAGTIAYLEGQRG